MIEKLIEIAEAQKIVVENQSAIQLQRLDERITRLKEQLDKLPK